MTFEEFMLTRLGEGAAQLTMYAANFDPARMLTEIDAKRRILAEHPMTTIETGNAGSLECCSRCSSWSLEGLHDEDVPYPCPTLQAIALPWSACQDYDETWRL